MRPAVLAAALFGTACSSLSHSWTRAGYDASGAAAVKRIAVVAWAPPEHPQLAPILSTVASDRIKLKLNYLVHSTGVLARGWSEACGELEGVLAIQTLHVAQSAENTELALAVELYSCKSGALLWRAEATDSAAPNDQDLAELTQSYARQLGDEAAPYAAAAFLVLRELLDALPNVQLSDEELEEKIELGSTTAPDGARRAA